MGTLVLASTGGDYVAAAYGVFLVLVLVWVAIMATKIQRVERELGSLNELAEKRRP
jgi:type II secretory pathway component PulM